MTCFIHQKEGKVTHKPTLVFDEFAHAKKVAAALLDRPHADPDDDVSILARQFLRLVERRARATVRLSKEALRLIEGKRKRITD